MTHAVITVTELAQKLTDGAKLCIVDCRFDPMNPAAGQQAYLAGHIPGAHYAHPVSYTHLTLPTSDLV